MPVDIHARAHALWISMPPYTSCPCPPQLGGVYMRFSWSPPRAKSECTSKKKRLFLCMNSEALPSITIYILMGINYGRLSVGVAGGGFHRSGPLSWWIHVRNIKEHSEAHIWWVCVRLRGHGGEQWWVIYKPKLGEVALGPHMGVFSSRWFGGEWSI